jgi:hypothetical protein
MIPKIATKATGTSSNQTMTVEPLDGPNDIRNFTWPAIFQFRTVRTRQALMARDLLIHINASLSGSLQAVNNSSRVP